MKRIDVSKLNETMLVAASSQETQSGASKVWDNNFPLMPTPINRKVLIYFPKNFDQLITEPAIHDVHRGRAFEMHRCVRDLSTGFESFGYTGDCPFCQATQEAWDLYNAKLDMKAKELGIDRNNDPEDLLKATRETLLREMAVKNAEKYIVFPVVQIPSDDAGNPDLSGTNPVQPYFVMWRKDRYLKKLANSEVLEDVSSPAGLFMRWSFTYDTKGKQATAMDSAREMTCKVLDKPEILAKLNPFVEACEIAAAPFTPLKAIDNIKALNFYEYADIEASAESAIKATKQVLAQLTMANGVAPTQAIASAPTAAIGTAENVIANFGTVGTAPVAEQPITPAPVAPVAPAPVAPAPQVVDPTQFVQPIANATFGG